MASLSFDQARYRDVVAAGVPLDAGVVTAWIACESGWGVTKSDHNYLNIGPGRSYPTTDAAAAAAVDVAHQPNMNIGGSSPQAQLQSIVNSAWDAGHYAGGCLADTYNGLGGATVQLTANDLGGLVNPKGLDPFGSLGDATTGAIGDALSGFAQSFGEVLLTIALGAMFTAAALGLIVLGVSRLTGKSVSDRARSVANTATSAAAIAATV